MKMRSFWWLTCLLLAVSGSVSGKESNRTSSSTVTASSATSWSQRKYPKELHTIIRDRSKANKRFELDGTWSEWAPWSECSRSCGGGVSSQTRRCLHTPASTITSKRRRSASHHQGNRRTKSDTNQVKASNELDISETLETSRIGCIGLYKRYHLCNTERCPEGSKDFRQQQCESYNTKDFMGRYYTWEVYWNAAKPCELNCRAKDFGFYALLNKTVIDGTACHYNDPTSVCVAGSCKAIGCDGIVGSQKRPDGCGVCGGDNSTCQIVSGIFTEPHLPSGYNLVAQLPRGACHINITELRPSRNYLALRRADSTYVFNGNWAINWSGEYQAAGTTFSYRRQDATTTELISSPGPLNEPIDIMVIYQHTNPGIKYEYMLPLGVAKPLLLPQSNSPVPFDTPGIPSRWPDTKDTPYQSGIDVNGLGPESAPTAKRNSGLGAEGGLQAFQNIQDSANFGNENSSPISVVPVQSRAGRQDNFPVGGFPSLSSSGSLATLGIVPPFEPPVDVLNKPSKLGAAPTPAGVNSATQPFSTSSTTTNEERSVRRTHNGRHGSGRGHSRRRHHASKQSIGLEQLDQNLNGTKKTDLQTADTFAAPSDRRAPRQHSSSKGFSWKAVGFAACSKACGEGIRQPLYICIRESNQAQVADHRCKKKNRLQSAPVRCNTQPCAAEWVYGEWSACSVTCGDGIQTRDLACKQEISATLTMKVNDAACLTPPPSLPKVRTCNLRPCAKWQYSEWSKCSTDCGKGMRHRRVNCQSFEGHDMNDEDCSADEKPTTSDLCDMGSCSTNSWFVTEWSQQCSEECGTGSQTRKVHCPGADENICGIDKKPLTTRTCVSSKDCSGKWFTGPWSQCSTTCNEGIQTREVACLTFMRGQYRVGLDMQCPSRDKPETKRACHLGPCIPQWYITEWSECSAPCGTGAQRREVKCLDFNQSISLECREEDRPAARQACNSHSCNQLSEVDSTVTEIQDTPFINSDIDQQNETEPSPELIIKPRKIPKASKTHTKTVPNLASSTTQVADDSTPTTDIGGDGCVDKFKNCHLVVQARLCKLKYYLVSCCASCSKPKS